MENMPQIEHTAARSLKASVFVNLVLAVVQVIVGFGVKSQALVSDGFHTLSDLVADFVAIFAAKHSKTEADEGHPYGHLRYENAASLALGVILVVVGLGMIYKASTSLLNPSGIAPARMVALWVAVFTLCSKEILFRYMLWAAQKANSSMLVANAWHARSDAASSLVVVIGIAGSMMGYPILDPLAALLVGVLITRIGWKFSHQAFEDLVDASADASTVEAIRQTILAQSGVLNVHRLRTRKSADVIMADAHIEVDGHLSVKEGHDIAERVQNKVMSDHAVISMTVHVDPAEECDDHS